MHSKHLLLSILLSFSFLSLFLFLCHLHLQFKSGFPPTAMWRRPLHSKRYYMNPAKSEMIKLPPIKSHENHMQGKRRGRFTLLVGILTRADLYDCRHFLRLVYGAQPRPPTAVADIRIKFVLCALTKEEQKVLVTLEIMRFQDIIILNCTENMNEGKTYEFFTSLPHILPQHYDYVMKADDDVFIRSEALAHSLNPLERRDLYYGFVLPCTNKNPYVGYMSGIAFVLSWDIVEWIAGSNIPIGERVGPEDKLVGRWLSTGGKAKNRVTAKPEMYDYPGTNGRCSHELIPATVAVHRLKRWDRWRNVLRFFNVTGGLKPSKMYFIDQ